MKNLNKKTIVKSILFLFLISVFTQAISANELCTENASVLGIRSFYKSEKGALIYTRQIGKTVYWLAERFDAKFVSAFKGTQNGNQITGTYYNLPKGKAQGSGVLKVQISNGGKTLKITGGNMDGQVLTAIPLPSKIPARRKAHYSGSTTDNLTGWWHAKNAGLMHMYNKKKIIAGYFYGTQYGSNARPLTVKVFFGTRDKQSMKIEWIDLPIGLGETQCTGKATFKIVGPKFLKIIDGYFPGVNHERK